jgi:hypothetical protein
VEHQSRSYQPEQGGRTGGEPQAGGEPGARVPSQGDADGLQGRGQSTGIPGIHGNQLGHARREHAVDACGLAAHECLHRQLDAYGQGPPRQVRQMALIPAMHGSRGRGTQRTARARGGRRALEFKRLRRHGHTIEMHGAGGWEECPEEFGSCSNCINVHISSMYIRNRAVSPAAPKVTMSQDVVASFGRRRCRPGIVAERDQKSSTPPLPEHLVGLEEEGRGNREPERLGGLEIDDQLEFHGLLYGEITRLGAFQNFVHV